MATKIDTQKLRETKSDLLKAALVADGEQVEKVKITFTQRIGSVEYVKTILKYSTGTEIDMCFIIHDDGSWFSPFDWQGWIPEVADIAEIDWMLGVTGKKAVMFNGLPSLAMWIDDFVNL